MKRIALICCVLLCSVGMLTAQDAPAVPAASTIPCVTASVSSAGALMKEAAAIGNAIMPGIGQMMVMKLPMMLGTPTMAGVAQDRPVFVVMGLSAAMAPVTAVFVPVTDFNAFKGGLMPNQHLVEQAGDYAFMLLATGAPAADADVQAARTWKPAAADGHLISIRLALAPVRPMALMGLEQMKALHAMVAGMGQAQMAGDPTALIAAYAEGAKLVVEQGESIALTIDAAADSLKCAFIVTPSAGSRLQTLMAAPGIDTAGIEALVPENAHQFVFSGVVGGPMFQAMMDAILPASVTAQGFDQATAAAVLAENQALMQAMTPCRYTFFGDVTPGVGGLHFGGVYLLEKGRAAGVLASYGKLFALMQKALAMALFNPPVYKADARKLGDLTVGRIEMVINEKNPQFAAVAPQLKAFGFDRFAVEFTAVGDTIAAASAGDLEAVVAMVKAGIKPAAKPAPAGFLMGGSANLLALLKTVLPALGANDVPPAVLAALNAVDPVGTALAFVATVNGNLVAETRIPRTLFARIGKIVMKANAPAAGPKAGPPAGAQF
ncbi:MAG: hypothetical protein ABIF71_05355 [Planctomycetota bacterium]